MIAGRANEIELLTRLWTRASDGLGDSIAMVGEAGIGKTTLLRHLIDLAADDDAHVVYVDGVRGEESIAWGALARLTHLLTPWPDDLAAHHVQLLEQVSDHSVDRNGTVTADGAAVGAALLALTTTRAEVQPLIIAIDDLHWVDPESISAVRFLARRLARRRIALAVTALDDTALAFPHIVTIERLGRDDTRRIARDLYGAGHLSSTAVQRVIDQAAGNPARVRGIVESLSPEQRRGREPLPDPLPGDEILAPELRRALSELPTGARRVLAALSITDRSDTSLEDLLHIAQSTMDDMAAAERLGVIDLHHAAVRLADLRHRSVAYWSFPAPERRKLHARWATTLDDEVAQTLHLSRATVGHDGDLADRCRSLAVSALRRGDHRTAFDLSLEERSLQPEVLAQRRATLRAAEAALDLGDLTAARALIAGTDESTEPARRLAILAAIAEAELDLPAAVDLWSAAIVQARSDAPRLMARMLIRAAVALFRQSQMTKALELLEELEPDLDDADPIERIQLDILRGVAEISGGHIDASTIALAARYEELMELSDDELAPIVDVVAGVIAVSLAHFRQHEAARSVADRCERLAVERGLVTVAPAVATARCLSASRTDLPGAAMYGALAVELADAIDCPHLATMAESYLVAAEAHLGSPDTLAHIARLASRCDPVQQMAAAIATSGYWLTMGDDERALAAATSIDVPTDATLVLSSRWLADLAEAAARCRQTDIARSAIARMQELDGVESDDWLIGVIARTQAILAEPPLAEDLFAASVAAFERSTNTMSVARTELLWGESLRRARRRASARVHLERARSLFAEVGAGRWTERAERELVAAGAGVGSPDHSRDAERVLTPQEMQVARLAVGGASYRDIAARLFVSPRTIETHLSSVYRKIGVRNRAELSARAASDPALRPS